MHSNRRRSELEAHDSLNSTVAVALWALEDTAVSPSLDLVLDGVLDGGVGPVATNNPKWSPRPSV